ncbi:MULTISPECIES: hypothetical protein [Xenorhabdus]|uniref:hypothetical protein n=1 Tax=Xenorhabdus TaxID=626 RepID=UPI0006465A1B
MTQSCKHVPVLFWQERGTLIHRGIGDQFLAYPNNRVWSASSWLLLHKIIGQPFVDKPVILHGTDALSDIRKFTLLLSVFIGG